MFDGLFDSIKDMFAWAGKALLWVTGGVLLWKLAESMSGKDLKLSSTWESIKGIFSGSGRGGSSGNSPSVDVEEDEHFHPHLGIKEDARVMDAWQAYQTKNKGKKVEHKIPLESTKVEVTSGKGERSLKGKQRHHDGVDLGAAGVVDPKVLASEDGLVLKKGVINGYGNVVVVGHADGNTTVYAHLKNFSDIKEGQEVKQGAALGIMGRSSAKGGVLIPEKYDLHLHYEQRKGLDVTTVPKLSGLGDLSREAVNGGVISKNPNGIKATVNPNETAGDGEGFVPSSSPRKMAGAANGARRS
jgi:murein DD-endopeptidase MepM/ murein hydrolase activator NlpD